MFKAGQKLGTIRPSLIKGKRGGRRRRRKKIISQDEVTICWERSVRHNNKFTFAIFALFILEIVTSHWC